MIDEALIFFKRGTAGEGRFTCPGLFAILELRKSIKPGIEIVAGSTERE